MAAPPTPLPLQDAPDDRQTRERILGAAHRVFLRHGTSKARTADIAEEAGVNKALLHYYFATKAKLADAVFATAIADLMPRLFAILRDPARSIEDKVHEVVREQIDFHSGRPYLAGYVVSEMHTEPERLRKILATQGRPSLDTIRAQLDSGAAAGHLRPMSAETFVVNLIGLVVFPFVARPMLEMIIGLDATRFPQFLEERKRLLPGIILASLRP